MKTLSKNAKPATIVPTRPVRAALVEVGGAAIVLYRQPRAGAGAALVSEPRRVAFAAGGDNSRMRLAIAICAACLLAGCGTPQELSKQAEEVHSVAAEGALLAHGAAEGDTTETFTSEHAKALRKLLRPVRGAIEDERLTGIADGVDRTLGELEASPGDEALAAGAERKLDELAGSAEELAG